jgi:hypothetical protein
LPSAPTSQLPTTQPNERKQVAAILARLSLHYWRPDYTPEQAKLLIQDYLDDLAGYSVVEIERAVMTYRRLPDSKFFPKSGELLAIMNPPREPDRPRSRLPTFHSSEYLPPPPKNKLRSVAEILRGYGFTKEAQRYEDLKS